MNMDQPIPINLSRAQWEAVLTMMAEQPFKVSAPLIGEIQRQCQMHEMRSRVQPPRLVPEDYGPVDKPEVG
jgi:hypothetical protein